MKQRFNPDKTVMVPGYILFLTIFAYVPWIFFQRVTRDFLNSRALVFTVLITVCISIIWEVTLALPRGYWNYNHEYMIGFFVGPWSSLPVEAITVWVFSSLIILSYEYTKLLFHRNAFRRRYLKPPENLLTRVWRAIT
jgi:hypothetical protein